MGKAILECIDCGEITLVDTNVTIGELISRGKIKSNCKRFTVTWEDYLGKLFMRIGE